MHSWILAKESDLCCRKWRVISHPLNTNPFPGSFLNYRGRLRLRDVTINGLTLVELEGAFDTEHTVSTPPVSTNLSMSDSDQLMRSAWFHLCLTLMPLVLVLSQKLLHSRSHVL